MRLIINNGERKLGGDLGGIVQITPLQDFLGHARRDPESSPSQVRRNFATRQVGSAVDATASDFPLVSKSSLE
jgi:hypothetical protein